METSNELLSLCCTALDDKKATDITVIDVSKISSVTNYVVIATATSEPHLKALQEYLKTECKSAKHAIVGSDYETTSGWMVLDAFEVMVHAFTETMRDVYSLEQLWRSGKTLPTANYLNAA